MNKTVPGLPPQVDRRDVAACLVEAALAIEQAWQLLDPRVCGSETYDRMAGANPLESGPLHRFYGTAPGLIKAARALALRADRTALMESSSFGHEPNDEPEEVTRPEPGGPPELEIDPDERLEVASLEPTNPSARLLVASRIDAVGYALSDAEIASWTVAEMVAANAWAVASLKYLRGEPCEVPPTPEVIVRRW